MIIFALLLDDYAIRILQKLSFFQNMILDTLPVRAIYLSPMATHWVMLMRNVSLRPVMLLHFLS